MTAARRRHRSCLYSLENTDIPYAMQFALRFTSTGKASATGFKGVTYSVIPPLIVRIPTG
jgi:hypothetical protein